MKSGGNEPDRRDISRHITTLILTILTGLFIFISYHLFSGDVINLLHWHVFLATTSCLLFMPWAILSINSHLNILTQPLSQNGRNVVHIVLQILAFAFAIASLICIVIYKEDYAISHFVTDHSKVGLSAIIMIVIAALGGALIKPKPISPKLLKNCHSIVGISALVLALTTECLGFDKPWFYTLTYRTATRDACITLSVISIFWVIVRPFINVIDRLRN